MARIYIEDGTIEIERIYEAVAERRPHAEILQMIYDVFGAKVELRPPPAGGKGCAARSSGGLRQWLIRGSRCISPPSRRLSAW